MKKFISLLIMILSVFIFAGCADVAYYFEMNKDGEINMGAGVSVDTAKLTAASTLDGANNDQSVFDYVTAKIYNSFNVYKLYYERVFSAAQNFNEHINWETTCTTPLGNSPSAPKWEVKVNIKFFSYDDYVRGDALIKADQELLGETLKLPQKNTPTRREEIKIFTRTVYYSEPTKFASYFADNELMNELTTTFSNANINADVRFAQTITSQSSKMKSKAQKITRVANNLYLHTFIMTAQEAQSGEIVTYYVYPNPVGWYLLTMILTAIFITAYLLYVFYMTPGTPGKLSKRRSKLKEPKKPKKIKYIIIKK